jgi:hypothetical protein
VSSILWHPILRVRSLWHSDTSRLLRREKLPNYNTITDAVSLIRQSQHIVILTGAGISWVAPTARSHLYLATICSLFIAQVYLVGFQTFDHRMGSMRLSKRKENTSLTILSRCTLLNLWLWIITFTAFTQFWRFDIQYFKENPSGIDIIFFECAPSLTNVGKKFHK